MTHQYRLGDLLIDPTSFRLLQAGKPVPIEPKALNVLLFLVQNPGRLIERRELLNAVWGDAFVIDHVLNRSIGQLRKVLGDDAKEPRYIETVPTLGYRFIAFVEVEGAPAPLAHNTELGEGIALKAVPSRQEIESGLVEAVAAESAGSSVFHAVNATGSLRPATKLRYWAVGTAVAWPCRRLFCGSP